jgi:hypothetical protein
MADKPRSIQIVPQGLSGPIAVNGAKYDGVMPPVLLTDEQVANVLTYVPNSWGNQGEAVLPEEVTLVCKTLREAEGAYGFARGAAYNVGRPHQHSEALPVVRVPCSRAAPQDGFCVGDV